MNIEITPEEREVLVELLEAVSREQIHQLHHTASNDYRRLLRKRLEIIERLTAKFTATAA
jgi:hypothetical protein